MGDVADIIPVVLIYPPPFPGTRYRLDSTRNTISVILQLCPKRNRPHAMGKLTPWPGKIDDPMPWRPGSQCSVPDTSSPRLPAPPSLSIYDCWLHVPCLHMSEHIWLLAACPLSPQVRAYLTVVFMCPVSPNYNILVLVSCPIYDSKLTLQSNSAKTKKKKRKKNTTCVGCLWYSWQFMN